MKVTMRQSKFKDIPAVFSFFKHYDLYNLKHYYERASSKYDMNYHLMILSLSILMIIIGISILQPNPDKIYYFFTPFLFIFFPTLRYSFNINIFNLFQKKKILKKIKQLDNQDIFDLGDILQKSYDAHKNYIDDSFIDHNIKANLVYSFHKNPHEFIKILGEKLVVIEDAINNKEEYYKKYLENKEKALKQELELQNKQKEEQYKLEFLEHIQMKTKSQSENKFDFQNINHKEMEM